ncbi:hypothetical protein H5410_030396, partial [Solanum commersonii]
IDFWRYSIDVDGASTHFTRILVCGGAIRPHSGMGLEVGVILPYLEMSWIKRVLRLTEIVVRGLTISIIVTTFHFKEILRWFMVPNIGRVEEKLLLI